MLVVAGSLLLLVVKSLTLLSGLHSVDIQICMCSEVKAYLDAMAPCHKWWTKPGTKPDYEAMATECARHVCVCLHFTLFTLYTIDFCAASDSIISLA